MGCDGIFDKLEDKDCVHSVWQSCINTKNSEEGIKLKNEPVDGQPYNHGICAKAVDTVLKTTAIRRSADNITVVMVAFDNFFDLVRESKGEITKFEHAQIELKQIDLLRPPYVELD